MAGFLLIHGAMHGGWCFDPVADILRARGHVVDAPDLPGMGGDPETLRSVSMTGWTDFALEHLRALRAEVDDGKIVMAGHSRGGLNVSAAAEADPTAMDALVYICALMLPSGMSREGMRELIPANPDMASAAAETMARGLMLGPEHAVRFFAQLSPPHLAEAAARRLVAEPPGPLSELVEVTAERWGSLPRTYIECMHDRTIAIEGQRKLIALSPGTRTVTLEADHSPFFSAPDELADALEKAVP